MTFPIDIHIGALTIPSHLIFEMLAYTLGFRYFLWLRKRQVDTIETGDRIWILIGAAFGALVGARLVGILENPSLFSTAPSLVLYVMASKTIVGGLLGGLVGTELTKKIIGVHTSSGDLITYPLLLAIMIGRVGCFLAGVEDGTYGTASTLPWALDMGDGIQRHPTNLYEILFLGLLWLFLRALERRVQLADGARFRIFLASYLLFRFCIEFIKPVHPFVLGLGIIQLVCLAGLVYYWRVFLQPTSLCIPSAGIANSH